jgi:nitrile hydratase subunit beta
VNGIHDLGGMHGFGPIVAEPQDTEPVFHAEWEKSVLALFNVMMPLGRFSLDRFRRMIETQPPLDYLRHSYYENWLASISRLAVDSGLVGAAELAGAATAITTGTAVAGAPPPAAGWKGTWSPVFASDATPRYAPGDRVRARTRSPEAHTREPRYVRGHVGIVVRHAGAEPLPELAAENVCVPEHLYCVRFEASELWGPDATSRDALYIELWETYLEPAS